MGLKEQSDEMLEGFLVEEIQEYEANLRGYESAQEMPQRILTEFTSTLMKMSIEELEAKRVSYWPKR
jgi:predicted DNA-binding transcriptional regulator